MEPTPTISISAPMSGAIVTDVPIRVRGEATNLDVVKELPQRKILPVDTQRKRRKTETTARLAGKAARRARDANDDTDVNLQPLGLKASDEGQVNLDVDRLRTKTHRLEKTEIARARKGDAPLASNSARIDPRPSLCLLMRRCPRPRLRSPAVDAVVRALELIVEVRIEEAVQPL